MTDTILEIIDDASGRKRVRLGRRIDGLYTYYVEELRDGDPPRHHGDPNYEYWGEVRYGTQRH